MPTPAATPDHPDLATLTALRAGIRRPRVSFLYTVGLALVAGAMVLLPLVYIALVGAMGYVVYWHATEHLSWFASHWGGWRFQMIKGFAYVSLLLAGIVVVFFLLKPLFAKRQKRPQPLALHPGAEPRLYAFIEAVCKAVGAPHPRRIDLDAQLNASASFRRGFLSFLGGDLVLTLGLPLVANLSVAELAGVVAHEFGHFTQGLAMRLGYVVDRVNAWFARVVYERDRWDATLEDWAEDPEDWRIGIVVWTAQLGVGLSRLVLRVLMYFGVALSGFLSRQMEFHADASGIRLSGSETFELTTRKFASLAMALGQTQQALRQGWNRSRRLPDNLPELIRRVHDDLPASEVTRIHDTLGLGQTQWFDTHPCPAERIRRSRRMAEPGIVADDRPAHMLFEDFDVPARQVTELYYTDELELPVTPGTILPLSPRSVDPSETSGSDDPPAAAIPLKPSIRDPETPPVDDALLLGAPELLLPLPVQNLSLAAPDESTARSTADSAALAELVSSLESVRSRVADLAVEARRVMAMEDSADTSLPDLSDLRHSVHEVAAATARRLNLGLNLAADSLDSAERQRVEELHHWLRSAQGEYAIWTELAIRLPRLAAQASQAAVNGELPPSIQSALDDIRSIRSQLKVAALVPAPSTAKPRKLWIGPTAEILRELEALQNENAARLASYRHALSELWAVAAPQETKP